MVTSDGWLAGWLAGSPSWTVAGPPQERNQTSEYVRDLLFLFENNDAHAPDVYLSMYLFAY
jgi:hypothetical protein